MISEFAFRPLYILVTLNLLLISPTSLAMREALLTINNLPTGYTVHYPADENQRKATLKNSTTAHSEAFTDTPLAHYLLGRIIGTKQSANLIPIEDNHPTVGSTALLNTHMVAAAFHRGDRRLTQNAEDPINLSKLFYNNKVPTLSLSDTHGEFVSVFEGDIQVDSLPAQTGQFFTHRSQKKSLIVIRQKLYPTEPLNNTLPLNNAPFFAVVEYMYERNNDDSVSPYIINIYRPAQQTTLKTRLEYLTGGVQAIAMKSSITGYPPHSDSLKKNVAWTPITESPLATAVAAGVSATAGFYLGAALGDTASHLISCAPSNWITMVPCCGAEFVYRQPVNFMASQPHFPSISIDWSTVGQFLSNVPEAIANGAVYAANNVPGLYVITGSGVTTAATWLYFNKAKRYANTRDFQNALIAFVLATEKEREIPSSIAPFRAAFSDPSDTAAINVEVRTRRTSHHINCSTASTMVDHKNTTTIVYPTSSGGLRQRK